jgi:predicted amidohydrolase
MTMDRLRLWMARWTALDPNSNLARCRDEVARAVQASADIVIFPELFLTGYTRNLAAVTARDAFAEVSAAAPGTLIVFGSLSDGAANRLTAWLDGREVAVYDKVHLFEPNGELELWTPGSEAVALLWRGLTIGFMNCNDVRYPELARTLRLAAAELLIVPAWWPWRRDHVWAALLRARAIENACWVAGCCIAQSTWPGEEFAGAGNHVFDPGGEPVRTRDDLSWDLDLAAAPPPVVDPLVSPSPPLTVRVESVE